MKGARSVLPSYLACRSKVKSFVATSSQLSSDINPATESGDFVWVKNDGNRSVYHCCPSKLGRKQHGTFNRNMSVDKSGQQPTTSRLSTLGHCGNLAIFHLYGGVRDLPPNNVHHISVNLETAGIHRVVRQSPKNLPLEFQVESHGRLIPQFGS